MYFQNLFSTCFLFCILFAVIGRDQPVNGAANDTRSRYEQLLHNRLKLQEEILKGLEGYRIKSQSVREGRAEFKLMLGDKSVSEAIEMFTKNNILPALRPAYSRWLTLLPEERARLVITQWLDKQQASYDLENMEAIITDVNNRRDYDWAFDKETNDKISRSLAQMEASLGEFRRIETEMGNEEVIKNMVTEMEKQK